MIHRLLASSSEDSHTEETHAHDLGMGTFCLALTIGIFCKSFLNNLIKLPYTVIILILGLLIGLFNIVHDQDGDKYISASLEVWVNINPEAILFTILPILIYESAFSADLSIFRDQLKAILTLAGPGVLFSAILTAIYLKYALPYDWSWSISLMFGSVLAATDPIAVVAILKELGVAESLSTLIEGESLLNDGTAIVLYSIFSFPLFEGESLSFHETVEKACILVFVGPLIGLIIGKIGTYIVSRIMNDVSSEITVTVVAAYGAFTIAELCHSSGVLAMVVAGLYMSFYGIGAFSPRIVESLHSFWGMLGYLTNTLIFFISGLITAQKALVSDYIHGNDYLHLFALYIVLNVIRFIMVICLYPVLRSGPYGIDWKQAAVLVYGGLRGAVGLTLALLINLEPANPLLTQENQDRILFHTAGIVFLTLIINGSTSKMLLQVLKLDRVSSSEHEMFVFKMQGVENELNSIVKSMKKCPFLGDADWPTVMRYIPCASSEIYWHRIAKGYIVLTKKELEHIRNADHSLYVKQKENTKNLQSTKDFHSQRQMRASTANTTWRYIYLSFVDLFGFLRMSTYCFYYSHNREGKNKENVLDDGDNGKNSSTSLPYRLKNRWYKYMVLGNVSADENIALGAIRHHVFDLYDNKLPTGQHGGALYGGNDNLNPPSPASLKKTMNLVHQAIDPKTSTIVQEQDKKDNTSGKDLLPPIAPTQLSLQSRYSSLYLFPEGTLSTLEARLRYCELVKHRYFAANNRGIISDRALRTLLKSHHHMTLRLEEQLKEEQKTALKDNSTKDIFEWDTLVDSIVPKKLLSYADTVKLPFITPVLQNMVYSKISLLAQVCHAFITAREEIAIDSITHNTKIVAEIRKDILHEKNEAKKLYDEFYALFPAIFHATKTKRAATVVLNAFRSALDELFEAGAIGSKEYETCIEATDNSLVKVHDHPYLESLVSRLLIIKNHCSFFKYCVIEDLYPRLHTGNDVYFTANHELFSAKGTNDPSQNEELQQPRSSLREIRHSVTESVNAALRRLPTTSENKFYVHLRGSVVTEEDVLIPTGSIVGLVEAMMGWQHKHTYSCKSWTRLLEFDLKTLLKESESCPNLLRSLWWYTTIQVLRLPESTAKSTIPLRSESSNNLNSSLTENNNPSFVYDTLGRSFTNIPIGKVAKLLDDAKFVATNKEGSIIFNGYLKENESFPTDPPAFEVSDTEMVILMKGQVEVLSKENNSSEVKDEVLSGTYIRKGPFTCKVVADGKTSPNTILYVAKLPEFEFLDARGLSPQMISLSDAKKASFMYSFIPIVDEEEGNGISVELTSTKNKI